jgi:membrane protein YqaA with SNARE-associated domain
MTRASATCFVADSAARAALKVMGFAPKRSPLMHFMMAFGPLGLFLVSIVDSSFIPLPIPGVTDIMLVLMAARHANWPLMVIVASAGSAVGGYFSYRVGLSGGMAFLEKRVPPHIFRLVCDWMERHAILAIALPAVLPPPMPLSPFVLAAGALKMSQRKFMTIFTISRTARHLIAAGLGLYYGRSILKLWDRISEKYAAPILIVMWSAIILSCAIAFWQLYRTSKNVSTASHDVLPESRRTA